MWAARRDGRYVAINATMPRIAETPANRPDSNAVLVPTRVLLVRQEEERALVLTGGARLRNLVRERSSVTDLSPSIVFEYFNDEFAGIHASIVAEIE
jgi:hypothetical protein